jgi:hypothetical protein
MDELAGMPDGARKLVLERAQNLLVDPLLTLGNAFAVRDTQ